MKEKNPKKDEGFLTKARQEIVSKKGLCKIGRGLNVEKMIKMNKREMRLGWYNNDKVIENTMEAIIGEMYEDIGYYETNKTVKQMINTYVEAG